MREKLLNLMKNEGLKPSQLAEALEVNPAGISHLMAGRNKPSFELLQKILRRFPRINPDWLLLDSTQMYRDHSAATPQTDKSNLFDPPQPEAKSPHPDTPQMKPSENRMESLDAGILPQYAAQNGLRIERVIVLYSDHSFDSYNPKQ